MTRVLERRILRLEAMVHWTPEPTLATARAKVTQLWNPGTFGPLDEQSLNHFAQQFLRGYERNRVNGYDVSTALRGATAGLTVWMRLSPAELRARCEMLLESSRARRQEVGSSSH